YRLFNTRDRTGVVVMKEKEHVKDWEVYEDTTERYIQGVAKNMTLYGITPSIGRLYGTLYFSDEPMTLDDMTEALKMSKTSMSTGIRSLEEMRMVQSTFKKGVRKDLYQSEEDWYKSFTSLFANRWKHHTETNIEEAEEAIFELNRIAEKTGDQQLNDKIEWENKMRKYAKYNYKCQSN